jgi:hypothetical protein
MQFSYISRHFFERSLKKANKKKTGSGHLSTSESNIIYLELIQRKSKSESYCYMFCNSNKWKSNNVYYKHMYSKYLCHYCITWCGERSSFGPRENMESNTMLYGITSPRAGLSEISSMLRNSNGRNERIIRYWRLSSDVCLQRGATATSIYHRNHQFSTFYELYNPIPCHWKDYCGC